jgi:flagellar basal-body rod protein FlgB
MAVAIGLVLGLGDKLMLPNLFGSTNIPILQEVLQFSQARHGVLVGNLANVNTPGYRTRDLSVSNFQERLKEAIAASRRSPSTATPGVLTPDPGDPMREVHESLTNILYHDDTNMDMEKQVAEITKNQYLHNFALSVMTNQIQLLQTAISERV